jgi:hypothetical protein
MTAKRALEQFFEENELKDRIFTVEHKGTVHMVESALLKDIIINRTPVHEQQQIRGIITNINFCKQ